MSDYPVQLVFDTPIVYSAVLPAMASLQAGVLEAPELDGVTVTSWLSAYTAFNTVENEAALDPRTCPRMGLWAEVPIEEIKDRRKHIPHLHA